MKYILFSIGPLNVYGYGFMIAIGVILAFWLASKNCSILKIDDSKLFKIGFWGIIAGFVGAKILYWITILDKIISQPEILLNFSEGFVVYGGLIGGFLGGAIYCKVSKINTRLYLAAIIPAVALAQGFGRMGCFLAGCCYGSETNSWIGMQFNESPFAPHGVNLIPTQLFSSIFDFVVAGILMLILIKSKKKEIVVPLYFIFYSIGRFIIEFFRSDPRGAVGIFSTSQFISIFVFFIGLYFLYFILKKPKEE